MMAWFFLRVPACGTAKAVHKFKKELRFVGAVRSCALGTAVDPEAGWFVVRTDTTDIPTLREKLGEVGLSDYVDLIEPLSRPTDGPAVARQLALF